MTIVRPTQARDRQLGIDEQEPDQDRQGHRRRGTDEAAADDPHAIEPLGALGGAGGIDEQTRMPNTPNTRPMRGIAGV